MTIPRCDCSGRRWPGCSRNGSSRVIPRWLGALSGAVAGLVAVTPRPAMPVDGRDRARPRGWRRLPVLLHRGEEWVVYDDSSTCSASTASAASSARWGTGILVNRPSAVRASSTTPPSAEGRRLRLRCPDISQIWGVCHHAGVVGHRFGDPLQGGRRDRRPARQRRDRA